MMTSIVMPYQFRLSSSHTSTEERHSPISSRRVIGVLCFLFVIGSVVVLVGPVTGWIRFCAIPSAAMAPTIAPGDRFVTEGFSLMMRAPRRGELIIFRTDGIKSLPAKQLFVKRIVGLPGERVQIANGSSGSTGR
jgi:signal peptidase I